MNVSESGRDGTIIPMRVRLKDEEGMLQSYSIKGCRKVDGGGFSMPDEVYISMMTLGYECRITSLCSGAPIPQTLMNNLERAKRLVE